MLVMARPFLATEIPSWVLELPGSPGAFEFLQILVRVAGLQLDSSRLFSQLSPAVTAPQKQHCPHSSIPPAPLISSHPIPLFRFHQSPSEPQHISSRPP